MTVLIGISIDPYVSRSQANLETLPAEGLADIDNDIKVVADDLESIRKKLKNVGNGENLWFGRQFVVTLIQDGT
jgi:hypothetical protein